MTNTTERVTIGGVNVINFDDTFSDLHASEWTQIIESVAKELSEAVAVHEASMTAIESQ